MEVKTLEERLAEIREGSMESIPAEVIAEMHRATRELKESGIEDNVLGVGAEMPGFSLMDTEGNEVDSASLLGSAPSIVTFYRGVW